jgi:hypothetical protein
MFRKHLPIISPVEILVVIAIIGVLVGLTAPIVGLVVNPPQQFQYGDRVYIKDGFFKGKSGIVVDKHSPLRYTVDIDDRKVEINSGDMAK